jgi:hypothetical protein
VAALSPALRSKPLQRIRPQTRVYCFTRNGSSPPDLQVCFFLFSQSSSNFRFSGFFSGYSVDNLLVRTGKQKPAQKTGKPATSILARFCFPGHRFSGLWFSLPGFVCHEMKGQRMNRKQNRKTVKAKTQFDFLLFFFSLAGFRFPVFRFVFRF